MDNKEFKEVNGEKIVDPAWAIIKIFNNRIGEDLLLRELRKRNYYEIDDIPEAEEKISK